MAHFIRKTVLGLILGLTAAGHATAANWPERPITFILPSAPGGVTDAMTRHFAQAVSEELKQPVVVLNRPGASGTIALQAALNASADGYTFVVGYPSNLIAPRYQFKKLGFNADNDFIPISELAINEMVVVGNANLAGSNLKAYIADAQKHSQAVDPATMALSRAPAPNVRPANARSAQRQEVLQCRGASARQ